MLTATRVSPAACILALGVLLTPVASIAVAAPVASKPHDFGTTGPLNRVRGTIPIAGAAATSTMIANTPVCVAPFDQTPLTVIPDGSGGVIAAWADFRSGDQDIFAQKLNAAGDPVWPEDGVPVCKVSGAQTGPKLLSDGAGGAFIVWEDSRAGSSNVDIYAQRLSSVGVPQWTGGGVLVCGAANNQTQPVVGPNGLGGLLIAWVDRRGVDADVYVQRLNAAGVPQWTANGVALCTAVGVQADPTVVSDGAGGSIVAWRDERAGVDIYTQRVNEQGVVQWTANGVALCTAAGNQETPAAVIDGAGGAIVTWQDARAGGYDVYAQRVSAAGAPQWTANGVALCSAAGDQLSPRLCTDGLGGAFVTWEDHRGADADVYAQQVNGAGAPQWAANGVVVCSAPDQQLAPTIATDPLGGAVVAWSDSRTPADGPDIFVQHLQSNGTSLWTANGVLVSNAPGVQDLPQVVADGSGGAAVTWRDYRNTYADLFGQRLDAGGQLPDQCVPPDTLVQDSPFTTVATQNYRTFDQCSGGAICWFFWAGVGVRGATGDWDLEAYDNGGEGLEPYPVCFGLPLAGSYQTYGTDFVMFNFNENHTPPTQIYGVRAYRYSGSGSAMVEWDAAAEQLDFYNLSPSNVYTRPSNWTGVLDVVDTQTLTAGTTYTFQITHDAAADIHLLLFSSFNSPGYYYVVPRSSRVMETTGWGTFTSPFSDHYGLAIVNDNGGPGGYTLKMWSVPVTTGVDDPAPAPTGLTSVSPNPGRGPVTIDFAMRESGKASFRIFDMAGRTVGSIPARQWQPGRWSVRWDGNDPTGRPLSAGLYFVQMNVDDRRVGFGRITLLH
jgi:hypothetical protein